MTIEQPEKQAVPQITVIVSGINSEGLEANGEDASVAEAMEGGAQDGQGGITIHKDVVGVFSRRMMALEHRMDLIERQIKSLNAKMNGKLSRIEDKLKALSKVQQEILRKLDELDSVQHYTSANNDLPTEISTRTRFACIVDRLPLEQKRRRMWTARSSSVPPNVAQIRRARHPRLVKLKPDYNSNLVKCYRRMRAKRAALASAPLAVLDGSAATTVPLASTSHQPGLNDMGPSSASTSSGLVEEEPQL